MKDILVAAVLLSVLTQGTQAEYCVKYTSSYYSSSDYMTYIYCSDGCCGTAYSRYCCSYSSGSSSSLTYYSDYTYSHWSIGAIIGAAVGGFFGLCVLITIITAIIKACTKSGTHGRVVQPMQNPHDPNLFVTNTSTGAQQHPVPQAGMQASPYTGPGVSQPPPGPAYPLSGQTVPQGPVNTG